VVDRLNRQAVRREQTTDVSMLERLVAPDGKDVLDIGCGALVRELACRGARAIGLSPAWSRMSSRSVRRQAALAAAGPAGLDRVTTVDYDVRVSVPGLAGLRARMVSVDPARAAAFDARKARLAEAFERLGEDGEGEGEGEGCFLQPMRADVLRASA
jgi:hypothetical protein